MKNIHDFDENKNEANIPDHSHTNKTANRNSKHRIIHYDWTICMIREIIGLQMEVLVLKLYKIPLAITNKARITRKILSRYQQTGNFIKKEATRKKDFFLLGIFLLSLFTKNQNLQSASKIKTILFKIHIPHKEGTVYKGFACILTGVKINIAGPVISANTLPLMHCQLPSYRSECPHFFII